MQGYAAAFAIAAACSLMFVGEGVQRSVHHVGKVAVIVFTALFLGTEILALFT
ncbi:MAG: hypothetical protein ABI654_01835 [Betaproteobacteria bacterium]